MRKLAITLAVSTALGLTISAAAALPTTGKFAGATSVHKVNGFTDVVTFTAKGGGHSLSKFTFGTLGCFGHGTYPVGVNPFGDVLAVATIKTIPVAADGSFKITAKPTFLSDDGTITMATIQGKFVSSKSATGSISLTQDYHGDKCGPQKMNFTATPGTPTSLGLTGP